MDRTNDRENRYPDHVIPIAEFEIGQYTLPKTDEREALMEYHIDLCPSMQTPNNSILPFASWVFHCFDEAAFYIMKAHEKLNMCVKIRVLYAY